MKITRTAKELRSQSPAHHHSTWKTLRKAIMDAELYAALQGESKIVTVTESITNADAYDIYKIEIKVENPKKDSVEWLSEALNSGDGVYRP